MARAASTPLASLNRESCRPRPDPDESARRTRNDDGGHEEPVMLDVLQIVGAIAVLIPFVAVQLGRLEASAPVYLGANLAGSGVLAALALIDHDWGFLLLEGVWAAVAGGALVRRMATL